MTKIYFSKGIQAPAALGNLKLRLAGEGYAGYAQNVDVSNDEYGEGVATPGPAMTTIGNNSSLTGVPAVRQFFGNGAVPYGHLYFGQSILGSKTVVQRVKDIISGSTPTIDTGFTNGTIDHTSHTNQEIVDMVYRPDSSNNFYIYVAGKDDTDTWVYKFSASASNPTPALVTANGNFTGGYTSQFLVFSTFDNNLYWIGQGRVTKIDTSDAVTVNALALGLPLGSFASCGVDWQQQLLIASTDEAFGDFARRKSAGHALISIWDYLNPGIIRKVSAPCRYISAMVNAPDGNLLVFGGVDEGKSSIYAFTGYGFTLLTQYIGDMPRSRHSIEFDALGRVLFQTADGQLCRFDRGNGRFEHLGSITTGSSAGGILARGIGSPIGNDFFAASGSGSTYTLKKVQLGSFIGDGDSGSDTINTPLAVSGIQTLPKGSSIKAITLHLGKTLDAGEKVVLRIYKNGSTTPTEYMSMSYAQDGAVSSKRVTILLKDVNSYCLGVAWKMTDGSSTAPPVLFANVEEGTNYGNA